MDMKMHRKLTLISFMKQFGFNEKLSMSEIVNKALVEYLDNHADEFTDALSDRNAVFGIFYESSQCLLCGSC